MIVWRIPSTARSAYVAGMRAAVPLVLPVLPVGLVFGVVVDGTEQVSAAAGMASAPLVMGGASQLAAVSLLGTGAGAITAALTIAVINARHVMYSARLKARFERAPRWFRIVAPYVLFDQVFALAELAEAENPRWSDAERMGHYLGTGTLLAAGWWSAVAVGLGFGTVLPPSWSLDFTVPLLFLGLLLLSIRNVAGIVAAAAGGLVAVLASGVPNSGGLLLGAVVGVAAGGVAERVVERRSVGTTGSEEIRRGTDS